MSELNCNATFEVALARLKLGTTSYHYPPVISDHKDRSGLSPTAEYFGITLSTGGRCECVCPRCILDCSRTAGLQSASRVVFACSC